MKSSVVKTQKRIGVLSVVGAIALSASTIVGPSAFAASPYTNSSDQPAYQNGQTQNGQTQNGYWQNGQWHNNQNGQWQNNQNGQAYNNTFARQRYDWSAYRAGHQPPQWQQYHRDFNPRSYQWNRTSNQRYHNQSYQRPQGWYPHRWAYGQILPQLFWSQNYWLTGYYNYGLIDPPYGYVWVQNGNDALLVDVQSGQILSVEYNVFYS